MEGKRFKIDGKKIGIGIAKTLLGGAASFGVGFIISRYGKAAIMPNDKTIKKVLMIAGATVLANMVGDAASNYVGGQIDTVVNTFDGISKLGKAISEGVEDEAEFEEEDEDV